MKTSTLSNDVGVYHRGMPYMVQHGAAMMPTLPTSSTAMAQHAPSTHLQFPNAGAAYQFYLDQMPTGSTTLCRTTFYEYLRKTGFVLPFPQGHQRHGLAFLYYGEKHTPPPGTRNPYLS
mmetsp:Transcript_2750/g.6299  ORF Transcript_2750/g.6299 Transcript_2750/m.6299 type:complete len:119 (-) Transcript_2750:391-747(-)